MKQKISNHYTYNRGPLGATLSCNHCGFHIKTLGSKLQMGIVTTLKGEMGNHLRNEHPIEVGAKIKPDVGLTIWTPDTVAETMPVSEELYRKLWSLVDDYPDQRSPEEMEYPDAMQSNNVAQFWNRFSDAEKLELNKAAQADD